jgi:Icc protein
MAIQLLQLTDTHLFEDETLTSKGVATVQSFQAVLTHLRTLPRPDLLLLTGDLSQDETAASYHRLYRAIAPLGIPTYWLPGNHDQPQIMQQILNQPPFSAENRIEAGEWVILLLNSVVPGEVHGELSSESLAWLKENLQTTGNRPVLIALHHPPLLTGSTWMDGINLHNSEIFQHLISQFPNVKLVLFGHIHQELDQEIDGVRYLATPSTCVQFQPNSDEFAIDGDRTPGFRQITLFPDGTFTTRVIRIERQALSPAP